MKTFCAILLVITIINCSGQNNKIEKMKKRTFDIEKFNKKKEGNSYFFVNDNGNIIKQYEGNDTYWETVRVKDEQLENFYEYYKNGILQRSVKRYPKAFALGTLKEYDKQGNLTKEENLDKPFSFSWEDVKTYLTNHNVTNFQKQVIGVSRFSNSEATLWTLEFQGTYKESKGRYLIKLDGKTGEELEVKMYKGKGALGETGTIGVYEVIYEKN